MCLSSAIKLRIVEAHTSSKGKPSYGQGKKLIPSSDQVSRYHQIGNVHPVSQVHRCSTRHFCMLRQSHSWRPKPLAPKEAFEAQRECAKICWPLTEGSKLPRRTAPSDYL